MLEGYFWSGKETNAREQRLRAVQAALEIIKASASAPTAYSNSSKIQNDSEDVAKHVGKIADAIQEALKYE